MANDNSYRLHIQRIDNETFMASVVGPGNDTSILEVLHGKRDYDDNGALTYVVAVIFIYGFSVIFIIASLVKKTRGDHGVSTYMSDLDKIRQLEHKQNKKNKVKTILKKVYKERRERGKGGPGLAQDTPRTPLMVPPFWGIESSSRQSSNWSLASYREEDEVNYLLAPSTSGCATPSSPKSLKDDVRQDTQWRSDDVNDVVSIPVIKPAATSSSVEVPVIVETAENPYKLNLSATVPPICLDTLHEEEEEHSHLV